MNIAVVFAGGVGKRMRSKDIPKQFIKVHDKPIIIHTIQHFENNPNIDSIVISCIEEYIDYLKELLYQYRITKVKKIVKGGSTGQLSIYNGLLAAKELAKDEKAIVLIHDGVRPLINSKLISENIESVKKYGSAITTSLVKETIIIVDNNNVLEIPNRSNSRVAKAPQSFYLDEILEVHEKALKDGIDNAIDSCTLMQKYGYKLFTVDGPDNNIKITTPDDYYALKAILDFKEDSQIYGLGD